MDFVTVGNSLNFLTVEEAAARLGVSVSTVRRRAAAGLITARKSGGQWLIEEDSLQTQNPRIRRPTPTTAPVDLELALSHVKATDLNEPWVPDVLRYEDYLSQPEQLLASAARRLDGELPDPPIEVDVAKTHFFTRGAVMLSLPDRVAYQAVVASIAPAIDQILPDEVYSARLSKNPRWFLEKGSEAWVRWKKKVKGEVETGFPWMIKSDLTSYFDSILHSLLLEEIVALGPDARVVAILEKMLSAWAIVPGMGIPQGPNASRVLGNLYMLPVDRVLLEAGHRYYRYQDDIRILGKSKAEVIAGMRLFDRECRRRGLRASSGKTRLLNGNAAIEDCENEDRDSAQYHFDAANLPMARKELKEILRMALKKEGHVDSGSAKFSLWRLARIRESSILNLTLRRLEDLAPLPSVVAAYLTHFIYRRTTVQGVTSFLNDEARAHSPCLVTWLFAAMLERPTDFPKDWISQARAYTHDRNNPAYLRAMSACVLGRGGLPSDIAWIKQEISREHDPLLLRGYATGLAWAGRLDSSISNLLSRRSHVLANTVEYLRGRTELRSLIYSSQSLIIP